MEQNWEEMYERLNKTFYLFQQEAMKDREKLVDMIRIYDGNYVETKKQIKKLQNAVKYKNKPRTFSQEEKDKLMRKFNIKAVAGGLYGDGFFECLKMFDKRFVRIE